VPLCPHEALLGRFLRGGAIAEDSTVMAGDFLEGVDKYLHLVAPNARRS
jgi:hypothetical protein